MAVILIPLTGKLLSVATSVWAGSAVIGGLFGRLSAHHDYQEKTLRKQQHALDLQLHELQRLARENESMSAQLELITTHGGRAVAKNLARQKQLAAKEVKELEEGNGNKKTSFLRRILTANLQLRDSTSEETNREETKGEEKHG